MQKYQHFLFEATRLGIVKAQLVANGAFTEFNLLKTRKASVSEIIKEILIPASIGLQKTRIPLSYVRPFLKDEFKCLFVDLYLTTIF